MCARGGSMTNFDFGYSINIQIIKLLDAIHSKPYNYVSIDKLEGPLNKTFTYRNA